MCSPFTGPPPPTNSQRSFTTSRSQTPGLRSGRRPFLGSHPRRGATRTESRPTEQPPLFFTPLPLHPLAMPPSLPRLVALAFLLLIPSGTRAADPPPAFTGQLCLVRYDMPLGLSSGLTPTRQVARRDILAPEGVDWPDFTLNGQPIFRERAEEHVPLRLRKGAEAASPFQMSVGMKPTPPNRCTTSRSPTACAATLRKSAPGRCSTTIACSTAAKRGSAPAPSPSRAACRASAPIFSPPPPTRPTEPGSAR